MRILLAVLLSAGALFGQAPPRPVQGPPPKSLTKQPDGHVSANTDPKNPGNFETHVVQPGETLSQIAGIVLKDSKLWPQLWEQNEHIVNPHWIYPNDKILIRPVTKITEAVPPPVVEPAPAAPAAAPPVIAAVPSPPSPPSPPAQRGSAVIRPNLTVPPVVVTKAQDVYDLPAPRAVSQIKSSDFYCSGFVSTTAIPKTMKVASTYERDGAILSTEGNYIRIRKGSTSGMTAGSTWQVVRPMQNVDDRTGKGAKKSLGMLYLDVAQVQAVQVEADSALARVIGSCDAVEVGDLLVPFVPVDLPVLPLRRAFSSTMTTPGLVKGTVVLLKHLAVDLGPISEGLVAEGGVVYIDKGKGDGLKTGDLFIVYHGQVAIGEIAVLKVEEKASSALVTYSTAALVPGDRVERR